jgi:hypothetical protein
MRVAMLVSLIVVLAVSLAVQPLTAQSSLAPPSDIDPRLLDLGAPRHREPFRLGPDFVSTATVSTGRRALWGTAAMITGAAAGAAVGISRQGPRPDDEFQPGLAYGLLIGGVSGAVLGAALPSKRGTRCSVAARLVRAGGGAIGGLAAGALVAVPLGLTGIILVPAGTVTGAALAVRGCR